MLRTLLCDNHNHFLVVDDLGAISDLIGRKDHHLWLDLQNPTPEEFKMIEDEFSLHPLAIEDASVRHQRPKVDQYSTFYFVVFYAVRLAEADKPPAEVAAMGRRGLRGSRFHRPNPDNLAKGLPSSYEPGSLVGTPIQNGS